MMSHVAIYSGSSSAAVISPGWNIPSTSSRDSDPDGSRTHEGSSHKSRQRGGLSSLFTNPNASQQSPILIPKREVVIPVVNSRRSSLDFSRSDESYDGRFSSPPIAIAQTSLSIKDRSPASLQAGKCNSSPLVSLAIKGTPSITPSERTPGLQRRPSLSSDLRRPAIRRVGFQVPVSQPKDLPSKGLAGVESSAECSDSSALRAYLTQDKPFYIDTNGSDCRIPDQARLYHSAGHALTSAHVAGLSSIPAESSDALHNRERVVKTVERAMGLAGDPGPESKESSARMSDLDILRDAQFRHSIFQDPLVKLAFNVAAGAHHGQFRRNGEPVLSHCVETGLILAHAGVDSTVVAAGILHDVLDDTMMSEQQLLDIFGDEVTNLVVGVSKISKFSQMSRDNKEAMSGSDFDRLRTMFLAMVDVRVVLIKMADRLHNLRTLHALPAVKQQRMARETLDVFAPLANRLGIWKWKSEMEDTCFRFLCPEEHERLSQDLEGRSEESALLEPIKALDAALREAGIRFEDLSGRPKNLYSVHQKMIKKGKSLEEVYDVRGLRLIAKDEESCYAALEVVHKLWACRGEKHFKDYVKNPKANGYKSIHTVVQADDGHALEVQIRTADMHHQAEFGMAAHWRYKEGEGSSPSPQVVLQRIEWTRFILSWCCEMSDSKVRISSPKRSGFKHAPPPCVDRGCKFPQHNEGCKYNQMPAAPLLDLDCAEPVYVIIAKEDHMYIRQLAANAKAQDLLEEFAKEEGLRDASSVRMLVNHELVGNVDKFQLKMGDLVEFTSEPELDDVVERFGDPLLDGSDDWVTVEMELEDVEFHRRRLNAAWSRSTTSLNEMDRAMTKVGSTGMGSWR